MNLLPAFFQHAIPALVVEPDGRQHLPEQVPAAVLPGSFWPLHAGHLELAALVARHFQLPPVFELCVHNVDKPDLSPAETARRLRQFAWRYPVWVTRTPTFVAKARHFPGAVFVVGADTAERIVAARYYQEASGVTGALQEMQSCGCRFLVAGRRLPHGQFVQLTDLAIPPEFHHLFQEIPPQLFRRDISSTQLRQQWVTGRHD